MKEIHGWFHILKVITDKYKAQQVFNMSGNQSQKREKQRHYFFHGTSCDSFCYSCRREDILRHYTYNIRRDHYIPNHLSFFAFLQVHPPGILYNNLLGEHDVSMGATQQRSGHDGIIKHNDLKLPITLLQMYHHCEYVLETVFYRISWIRVAMY